MTSGQFPEVTLVVTILNSNICSCTRTCGKWTFDNPFLFNCVDNFKPLILVDIYYSWNCCLLFLFMSPGLWEILKWIAPPLTRPHSNLYNRTSSCFTSAWFVLKTSNLSHPFLSASRKPNCVSRFFFLSNNVYRYPFTCCMLRRCQNVSLKSRFAVKIPLNTRSQTFLWMVD